MGSIPTRKSVSNRLYQTGLINGFHFHKLDFSDL